MADKIKCVLLTKGTGGKVSLVGELEREEALTEARVLADKGKHAEVFSPDSGRIFFEDGSMKAYREAVAADKAKAIAVAQESKAAEKAARKKALEKELAELAGPADADADADADAEADAEADAD